MEARTTRTPMEGLDFVKFFLFDILAASFIGIAAWLITGDQVSSFLVSLVISVLILMVELRFQVASARHDLAVYADFDEKALGDPEVRQVIQNVLEGFGAVAKTGDALFIRRAHKALQTCATEMGDLREGYYEDRPEALIELLVQLLRGTQKSVCATSVVKVANYWSGGGAKEYIEENFKAVQRGVDFKRVFIIDSVENIDAEGRQQIERQIAGGIQVRVAFSGRLASNLLIDMGLVDDKYFIVTDYLAGLSEVQGFAIHRRAAELERGRLIFDRVFRESEDAAAFLARLVPTETVRVIEAPAR